MEQLSKSPCLVRNLTKVKQPDLAFESRTEEAWKARICLIPIGAYNIFFGHCLSLENR